MRVRKHDYHTTGSKRAHRLPGERRRAVDREQKFLKLAKAFNQLAAENVALKKSAPAPFSKLMMEALDTYHSKADDVPELAMLSAYVKLRDGLKPRHRSHRSRL